jgi:hypothetical protein
MWRTREHNNQYQRLPCEDSAKPDLALYQALIGLRSLGQWVRLDYRFEFSLRYEIKSFVEIFGAVFAGCQLSECAS